MTDSGEIAEGKNVDPHCSLLAILFFERKKFVFFVLLDVN
jgi:hypothetical protein